MPTVSRSAAAWQQPVPTDSRYTRIPRGLHDLARTPREYELMAALISFRWYPDSPIIPSVKTLAGMLRCSDRTVRRTAAQLETRGLLEREERRAPDDRQMSNRYVLCGPLLALVTAVEDAADQESHPSWQGRRSDTAGKRNSWKSTNRTSQQKGRYTQPSAGDFLMTRSGPYRPRELPPG